MMIFQPDRILLTEQIKSFAGHVRGKVLDIGAGGFARYQSYFRYEQYIKMDISVMKDAEIVASAESIPFKDGSFDSIICTQVFEHLRSPDSAAGEIYRILKKDGHCIITAPQTNELHEEPYDYYRYTQFGLMKLFAGYGFTIIECAQRGGFFATIAQLKIRYLIDKFNLYNHPILGKVSNQLFKIYGKFMIGLDSLDHGTANRKHALGWCLLLRK